MDFERNQMDRVPNYGEKEATQRLKLLLPQIKAMIDEEESAVSDLHRKYDKRVKKRNDDVLHVSSFLKSLAIDIQKHKEKYESICSEIETNLDNVEHQGQTIDTWPHVKPAYVSSQEHWFTSASSYWDKCKKELKKDFGIRVKNIKGKSEKNLGFGESGNTDVNNDFGLNDNLGGYLPVDKAA